MFPDGENVQQGKLMQLLVQASALRGCRRNPHGGMQ